VFFIDIQAAYLVGIADPASEPGRPGLVDQSQFARANQAIQMACQSISNPASTPQQVNFLLHFITFSVELVELISVFFIKFLLSVSF